MRISLAIGTLAVTAMLAGCASDRLEEPDNFAGNTRLQPLEAQPVAPVESGQLPDPTTDTAQFPQKPAVDPALQQNQMNTEVATNALEVKKEQMVGGWKVNAAGSNCDMFLTLTNLGSGSRGGTRGCAGELMAMGSWEVAGKQVVLKDRAGNTLATLYKTGENKFDGALSSGPAVSLSR